MTGVGGNKGTVPAESRTLVGEGAGIERNFAMISLTLQYQKRLILNHLLMGTIKDIKPIGGNVVSFFVSWG